MRPERDPARVAAESDLVDRARKGDPEAFETLYRAHVRPVYRFLRLHVADDATAEDLTQDVFLSALRGLHTFRLGLPFGPWIMAAARNRLANHWRGSSRRPREEPLGEPDPGSTDDAGEPDLRASHVARAMARLTPLQREVLAHRFHAELSVRETATAMRRSENAIKNLQFKALAALRRALEAESVL